MFVIYNTYTQHSHVRQSKLHHNTCNQNPQDTRARHVLKIHKTRVQDIQQLCARHAQDESTRDSTITSQDIKNYITTHGRDTS